MLRSELVGRSHWTNCLVRILVTCKVYHTRSAACHRRASSTCAVRNFAKPVTKHGEFVDWVSVGVVRQRRKVLQEWKRCRVSFNGALSMMKKRGNGDTRTGRDGLPIVGRLQLESNWRVQLLRFPCWSASTSRIHRRCHFTSLPGQPRAGNDPTCRMSLMMLRRALIVRID
jgi:hypothetical protein